MSLFGWLRSKITAAILGGVDDALNVIEGCTDPAAGGVPAPALAERLQRRLAIGGPAGMTTAPAADATTDRVAAPTTDGATTPTPTGEPHTNGTATATRKGGRR